ncbi:MAG: hypothetical protein KGV44_03535 [Flavobacteriaceae bacterium]|nr:hypothetical protein [Flavobacteriaceae bacterium]
MKKLAIFIVLVANISLAQTRVDFIKDFTRGELENVNYLNDFNQYDFSTIWTHTEEPLIFGIIGENHQRIRMKFISVKRNPKNKNEYFVYGKSKVKDHISEFKGTITLRKVLKLKKLSCGVDEMYKGEVKYEGVLIGDYVFKENKSEKGSGVFKGTIYSKWCIFNTSENQVDYDAMNNHSDSFENNSFIGVWQSFKTGKEKICNWGDYRVPMANDDFDNGVGDFNPSDKYLKFGWESYRKAQEYTDKKAREVEQEKWWE